jgi:hypothetical protein
LLGFFDGDYDAMYAAIAKHREQRAKKLRRLARHEVPSLGEHRQ